MIGLPRNTEVNCAWFLNQLEALPGNSSRSATADLLLAGLPEPARQHAAVCAHCHSALRDFLDTRLALRELAQSLPQPSPWFTARVMQSIAARERAIDESTDGFWNGVRRLAPRLVAFAALLLMLGGTWAFEQTRAARTHKPEMRSIEGIFESTPNVPPNDDVIAASFGEQP